jgi:hypothetical protein
MDLWQDAIELYEENIRIQGNEIRARILRLRYMAHMKMDEEARKEGMEVEDIVNNIIIIHEGEVRGQYYKDLLNKIRNEIINRREGKDSQSIPESAKIFEDVFKIEPQQIILCPQVMETDDGLDRDPTIGNIDKKIMAERQGLFMGNKIKAQEAWRSHSLRVPTNSENKRKPKKGNESNTQTIIIKGDSTEYSDDETYKGKPQEPSDKEPSNERKQ